MAITAEYDEERELLLVKVIGALSLEDVEQLGHSLLNSPQLRPDINTLWDLNEMDFNEATYELGRHLIAYRKGINGRRGEAKLALLSRYQLGEPVLKLYRAMSRELSQPIEIFRHLDEALEWLSE